MTAGNVQVQDCGYIALSQAHSNGTLFISLLSSSGAYGSMVARFDQIFVWYRNAEVAFRVSQNLKSNQNSSAEADSRTVESNFKHHR